MKKLLTKIKAVLTAFFVILVSFSSKVMGTDWSDPPASPMYGIPSPATSSESIIPIKIIQRLLIAITFIFGIVNFIKIRKIDDKALKKRKIKNTIIAITILIILIVALFIFAPSLTENFS